MLPGPEIELEIRSWFGTTTILVPPGVEVELTGGGFGATCNVELEGEPGPDAPVVRIHSKGPFGTLNVRNRPRIRDSLRDGVRALQEGIGRQARALTGVPTPGTKQKPQIPRHPYIARNRLLVEQ